MRNALRDYISDSQFRRTMLRIAAPITLQMLLVNGLSFVDTMMIGQLGETEVAAVGLANQIFFLVFLIFFGITSGTGIFVAQYWGDRDKKGINQVLGLSLSGTALFAVPFTIMSIIFPDFLMRLFTKDARVVELGAIYLKTVAPSYIFSAISFSFAMTLRSIERPNIPLLATAVSMAANTVLNLVLIFGYLGFPALGVQGAAIGTLVGRTLEMVVIYLIVRIRQLPVSAPFKEYFSFKMPLVKQFFRTAGPVLMNEIAWSLGMVMYKVVFARMGTDVIAAANITESIQSLFFVVLIGTGNTAAIMIGKKIGEGKRDEATRISRHFLIQGFILGLGLGLLMSLSAPVVVLLLNMRTESIVLIRRTLIILGLVVPWKALNIHLIVGILRSGGDTTFSFFAELIGVWGIGVPIAFITGLVLDFTLPVVYLLVGIEELFKFVITIIRFRSGKWMNDLTREHPSPKELAPPPVEHLF